MEVSRNVICGLISSAMYSFDQELNKLHHKLGYAYREKKHKKGQHVCVPTHGELVIELLNSALAIISTRTKSDRRLNFVDAGCGIGNVLYIASLFGEFNVHGLDIETKYLQIARKLVPLASLEKQDILKTDYSKYDVIYFYTPMSNISKQRELEKRIVTTARDGAIILGHGQASLSSYKELTGFGKQHGYTEIFIKDSSKLYDEPNPINI